MLREMIVAASRHVKKCDILRCDGKSAFEFARTNSAGKLDLCQDCIDDIAKYATKVKLLVCQYCGRECKGKMGLLKHESACVKKVQE